MKAIGLILTVAVLSLAGLSTALASDSGSRATTVSTAKTHLGKVIVNGRGLTLYLFEKDRRGKSMCSGACATYWPPLITHGKPMAAGGARQSLLGTIKRSNGARQVTYAGHPLYYYAPDRARGQITGQALNQFGAPWYALAPSGTEIHIPGM